MLQTDNSSLTSSLFHDTSHDAQFEFQSEAEDNYTIFYIISCNCDMSLQGISQNLKGAGVQTRKKRVIYN